MKKIFLTLILFITSNVCLSEETKSYDKLRDKLFDEGLSYNFPPSYTGNLPPKLNEKRKCMITFTKELRDMELDSDVILERLLLLGIKVDVEFTPIKSYPKYVLKESTLEEDLTLKAPIHPKVNWCDKDFRDSYRKQLSSNLRGELNRKFPLKIIDMLEEINRILASDLGIIEKCGEIEKLQNKEFGDYKLNETTGDIYLGKTKVTSPVLKRELYKYFYKIRIGNKTADLINLGNEYCRLFSDCGDLTIGPRGKLVDKKSGEPVKSGFFLTNEAIQAVTQYLKSKFNWNGDSFYEHIIRGTELNARHYNKGVNPVYVCLVSRLRGPSGEIKEIETGCTQKRDFIGEDRQDELVADGRPNCEDEYVYHNEHGRMCPKGKWCTQTFKNSTESQEVTYHSGSEYVQVYDNMPYVLSSCPKRQYIIDGEVSTPELTLDQVVENGKIVEIEEGESVAIHPETGERYRLKAGETQECIYRPETRCWILRPGETLDKETGTVQTLSQDDIDNGVEVKEFGGKRFRIAPEQYYDQRKQKIMDIDQNIRYRCDIGSRSCTPCNPDKAKYCVEL